MSVTRAQVLEVAALARLSLSEEETERFAAQLGGILDHVGELELVGEDSQRAEDGTGPALPLRTDAPAADALAFPPEQLAPAWRDGFFTVPRLSAMEPGAGDNEDAES